ncbi:MAG TPA: transposase [Candidatus Obscuribacterales bacterium]
MENLPCVGIDIAKRTFDVATFVDGKKKHKQFKNNIDGFALLIEWFCQLGIARAHVCMEATGIYGEALSVFLHETGHRVSVVNPARIHGFALSQLQRAKTDKADAIVIARFCAAMVPDAWVPPSPATRKLRDLVRHLQALTENMVHESHRRDHCISPEVAMRIEDHIWYLKDSINALKKDIMLFVREHPDLSADVKLVETIPGVGTQTAITLLAELPNLDCFKSARQLASFVGVTPRLKESGSSVRGKPRLSKCGNSRLRKALYFPAIVARQQNSNVVDFCQRMRQHGKSEMCIIGAVMRKLIHQVFAVLTKKVPYSDRGDNTSFVSGAHRLQRLRNTTGSGAPPSNPLERSVV